MRKFLYICRLSAAVKTVLLGVAFALLATACAVAQDEFPVLDQRAQDLNKSIMCPICPGESIDQSQVTIALQMRDIVREKLGEGWTDDQIRDFFVDRYGPSVLMEPPTDGFSVMAWIVPPVIVAVAIAAFLLAIKMMRGGPGQGQRAVQMGDASPQDGLERYYERIEAALEPRLARASSPTHDTTDELEESNG